MNITSQNNRVYVNGSHWGEESHGATSPLGLSYLTTIVWFWLGWLR